MPLLLAGVSCVSGQPFVGEISLAAPANPLIGSGFAPGSRIVIQGGNFGEQPMVRLRPIDAEWVDAEVMDVTPSRIVVVIPRDLATGPAELEVAADGRASRMVELWIVERRLVLFTREGDGYGPAIARHGQLLNRFDSAARPGERVSLLGIGLGRSSAGVKVLIGGRAIEPDFVGASSAIAGLDHIDFTLPWDAPEGCLVPFAIEAAGQSLNWPYTLSVSRSGGRCPSELPLGEEFWEKLDRGERVRVAVLSIERTEAEGNYAVSWQADYLASELTTLFSGDLLTRPAPLFCTLTATYSSIYLAPGPRRPFGIFTGASLIMAPPVAGVSGADGCEWEFTAQPDRRQGATGPANCDPANFRFGGSFQQVERLPAAPIPLLRAFPASGRHALSWSGNFGPGLLGTISWAFIPARGFLPAITRVTSCSLAGENGYALLTEDGTGLGVKRSVAYRVLDSEPGTDATLVRFVRLQNVPRSF